MLFPAGVVPCQTNRGILRKSTEKGAQASNLQAANCKRIASAGELLLELKALRVISKFEAKHLSRCWAPGRAAQIELELTSERFLEKSSIFGVMKKPILPYSFF